MRKILGLTVAALLVLGLVGGGTWAYFSDTETSGSNVLSAGTLDLTLGGATAPFDISDIKPGNSSDPEVSWTLTQAGSLSGNLTITMGTVVNGENTIWDAEADQGDVTDGATGGELGSKVKVALWLDEGNDGWDDANDLYLIDGGTTQAWQSGETSVPSAAYDFVDDFSGDSWSNVATLSGGGATYFKLSYSFPDSGDATDNVAQSDNCTFGVTFDLQQSS
jgi:spore coat-associated protein N